MISYRIIIPAVLFLSVLFSLNAEENYLASADSLIGDRKYNTAWEYLHEHADSIDFADFMIKKTELSLRYFALTNMHRMFAFKDLQEGEDLYELRKEQGNHELKLFDPEGGLSMAIEQNPERADLYYWLGEFYNEVLTFYGESWFKTGDELKSLIRENLTAALTRGMETEDLYSKLAHIELVGGNWKKAAEYLDGALSFDMNDPAYYQNLAIAQLNMNELTQAEVNAEMAVNLYIDPVYKADTCFLASTIALYKSRPDTAEEYLVKGAELSPGDFRFPDRLIRLYLSLDRFEDAREAAGDLFSLYPENPATCTTIVQYFYSRQKLEETVPFFDAQLIKFRDRPEVLGNIYFHKALTYQYMELPEKALSTYNLAEEQFRLVYPEDHQVLEVIKKRTDELKSADSVN